MKTKRNTIRKKMSLREYVNLINYFKTGEHELDLSEYDPECLSVIKLRAMRLSPEEKDKMDIFFRDMPLGVSAQSIMDTIPKIKQQIKEENIINEN